MDDEMGATALAGEAIMFRIQLMAIQSKAKFHACSLQHLWKTSIVFARLDFASGQRQNFPMADETSQRLEKLEAHIAHLEHQIEQMNEVVIEQGKLLERLKKEIQRASLAMQTLELERIKANNPRPPHH
jgi:uncharacterized coiled-coil protein SlyX